MTTEILLAGFGGQGVLFAGKVLAYCGLMDSKKLSWLPSYGPEMRGGTANCSVCISDEPIGSPLVLTPDILIAMNGPSYDKFINSVKSGGKAFIDSTLVDAKSDRTDIDCFYIPSTEIADGNDLKGGSNMVLLGKLIKETGIFNYDTIQKAIEKVVPASKMHLIENNLKAIKLGMNY
ncbi:MAG: 2-oxoacid:acceptor oxidoreductase family protein [Oscillospiraceae bacterium]|nr:2-oxoacid:acceptor oxidoreductase family protein [Oscillospiraceae bacterium]